MNPTEVVLEFLERINQCNADKLAELMTEDHVFIDSLGNTVNGRGENAPWLAMVDSGLVKQWHVYADNKPVYDIVAKSKPTARS